MGLMIKRGVVFGAIVVNIFGTRITKELELALIFAAAEPIILNVHCFGLTLDYGVVRNTNRRGVITLDGIFGLI